MPEERSWKYGLKSKDGLTDIPMSDDIQTIGSFTDVVGYRRVMGVVLKEESNYTTLFYTAKSSTQIYFNIMGDIRQGATFWLPQEYPRYWNYEERTIVKYKTDTVYTSQDFGTGYYGLISGEDSIYNYCYRLSGGIYTPSYSFPKSGISGRNVIDICAVASNDGIRFYAVGRSGTSGGNTYNNPCVQFGFIPSSILNNKEYFNPDTDFMTESEQHESGKGGDDDRYIDPSYKGNDIDFPDLPTGASALGFTSMKIFNPTGSQLNSALDILWTDDDETVIEQILESCKKWWYKPEQYCVSLMLTPLSPTTSGSANIKFGKYDSEVSAPVVSSQWQIVDCGTLDVPLKYGSYLDYTYTKAMIYLPFIGFRGINVNEIMGGTVAIKYYVDILTGSAVCFIKINNVGSNNSILYTYDCNVNTQIPLTSNNYNQVVTNMQRATLNTVSAMGNVATGNIGGATVNAFNTMGDVTNAFSGSFTPDVQISGSMTPNIGVLGNMKPYIVLHIPVSLESGGYSTCVGKPTSVVSTLGSFSGYTVADTVHLDGLELPKEIIDEIDTQIKSGIIL